MSFPYPNQRYTSYLGLSLFGMDEVLADNMNLIDQAYGAGSSINVNGTLVENPNLNNTTPAAPAGKSNVIWQVDGNGNISAYSSGGGGGTPGGSNGQFQFNNNGVFGGDAQVITGDTATPLVGSTINGPLFIGVSESSLNAILQSYIGLIDNNVITAITNTGSGGTSGLSVYSQCGVSTPQTSQAIYGVNLTTTNASSAGLFGSGISIPGNGVAVQEFVIGMGGSAQFGDGTGHSNQGSTPFMASFYAAANFNGASPASSVGVNAGLIVEAQNGQGTLNAAVYIMNQGTNAGDYSIYSVGGHNFFAGATGIGPYSSPGLINCIVSNTGLPGPGTPNTKSTFDVSDQYAGNSSETSVAMVSWGWNIQPTVASSTSFFTGCTFETNTQNSTVQIGEVIGFYQEVFHQGTGAVSVMEGLEIDTYVQTPNSGNLGVVGTLSALTLFTGNFSSSGSITDHYAMWIQGVNAPTTGGLTSHFRAIQIDSVKNASADSYAIYATDGKNYFGGSVALNSTLIDGTSSAGTNGQILSSTATGVKWIAAPSNTVPWNTIVNPTGNQLLGMGAFSTTWRWGTTSGSAETMWDSNGNMYLQDASAIGVANSPMFTIAGSFQSSPGYGFDDWTFQDVVGTGINGTSNLQLVHNGSFGASAFSIISPVAASGAAAFSSDGSSLTGWTNSGVTVDNTKGNPIPSFSLANGNYAYINAGVANGSTVQFQVFTTTASTTICDFDFGCNSSGAGPGFRFDGRGFSSGFFVGAGPFPSDAGPSTATKILTVANATWYTVTIVIAANGLSASWYVNGVFQASGTLSGGILGGFICIYNHDTSNVWFDNIQVYSNVVTANSPALALSGAYFNGITSATDSWSIQDVPGINPGSPTLLSITHAGTSDQASVSVPNLTSTGWVALGSTGVVNFGASAFVPDVGISRVSAGRLGIGNGVAGDYSAQLSVQTIVMPHTANGTDWVFNLSPGTNILAMSNTAIVAWGSGVATAGVDTGFTRIAAGVVGIGNGTASNIGGSLQLSQITSYNGESTVSPGIPYTRGATKQKAETGADASLLSVTPAAAAGVYRVTVVLSVSAASAATLGWTATWTDGNGHAQAPNNLALNTSGSSTLALTVSAAANATYYGEWYIDVNNAGTAIVIKTTFSGTSIAYIASATVERLQ